MSGVEDTVFFAMSLAFPVLGLFFIVEIIKTIFKGIRRAWGASPRRLQ